MRAASLVAQPIGGTDTDIPVDDEAARERILEAGEAIIGRLQQLADEQVRKKKPIEARWLEDLRALSGQYESDVEAVLRDNPERSRAFINMARNKTNGWRARLSDLLFPADDKNWGIGPTPVPELIDSAQSLADEAAAADAKVEQELEAANQAEAAGNEAEANAMLQHATQVAELAKALSEKERGLRHELETAKRAAEHMAREIDDQLTESKYPARARDVIDDGCKLGVGILKSPITASKPKRSWQRGEGNVYQLQAVGEDRPEARRVDPWAFFPDMNASSPEEWEFTFERHLPTKKELRKLTKTLGFDKRAVRDLLSEDGPEKGSNNNLNHLSDLRALNGEEAISGRYVLWEYHGPLEVEDIVHLLRAAGRDADADAFEQDHDPLEEHMVVMYFCNGRVLKISTDYVLDSGESLYSVFQFERGEGSVLSAIGVPRIMLMALRALNGAWRMTLDNAALSAGPQIVVDKTQVEPENGSWKLTPRKVWHKKSGDASPNSRPFEMFDIPNNQPQLTAIIELALKFIDDETALPLIAQGEQGQHVSQTLGGMSMLMNSANVVFRRVVKNWDDDVTTPTIRRFYDWNMQFSEKDHIKGDMQVEARGTSVLLVREIQSQQLIMIAQNWSQHPAMAPALKLYDAMRMALQSLSINPDDLLIAKDEFEKKLQMMAEGSQEESPETIRAQAMIQAAQINAESRLAAAQVNLQVAEIKRETELIALANSRDIELGKLQTMLASKQMDVDSKERTLAAEIGMEDRLAREARARGEQPTGSGGAISAGTVNA
jgi:hypothetical protein